MLSKVMPINLNTRAKLRELRIGSRGQMIFVIIMAYILGKSTIMGQVMPFGIAFIASITIVNRILSIPVLVGTLISILLNTDGAKSFIYLMEIILIFSLLFKQNRFQKRHWYIIPSLIIAAHLLLHGIFVYFWANDPYNWVVIIFEAIFAGLLSIVSINSMFAMRKISCAHELSIEEKASIIFMGLGFIIGLNNLIIGDINFQSVVSRWIVLVAAFSGGPGGGAVAGIIVGIVPNLLGLHNANSISFYALSGLVGGIFFSFRRIGVLVGFTLGNLLLSLYFGQQEFLANGLLETVIAGIIFLIFIPRKFHAILSLPTAIKNEDNIQGERVELYGLEQLKSLSHIFNNLSRSFSQTKDVADESDLSLFIDNAAEKVCDKCTMKRVCWEEDFHKTYRNIVEACTKLEFNEKIDEKDFGIILQRRCMRLRELGLALNSQLELYRLKRQYSDKLLYTRSLVANQLKGINDLTQKLVEELEVKIKYDESLGQLIKNKLMQKGLEIKKVSVMEVETGEREIALSLENCVNEGMCKTIVLPNIAQILGKPYTIKENYCDFAKGNEECLLYLQPSNYYDISIGIAISAKDGLSVSGDHLSSVELPNNKYGLILSDGMGHGIDAHNESKTAVEILESLLEAGLNPLTAIETVNSVLLLRSQEEKFATLDLAIFDKISGRVDLLKVGAAPSIIMSGGDIRIVNNTSLPAGILQKVKIEQQRVSMGAGDIIIMLSDGVWDAYNHAQADENWIINVIENISNYSPQKIADNLLYLAQQVAGENLKDDFSVLVASINYKDINH